MPKRAILAFHDAKSQMVSFTPTTMRLLKQLCLFLLAIVATSPAFATTFQVTVTGTVIAGTDTSGLFTGVPGASLATLPVTIVYYFNPSDISTVSSSCGFECTSAGTSASGYASIQVGTSAPYLDGSSGASESRVNLGWAPGYETIIESGYSLVFLLGNAQVSPNKVTPDFDWRSPFSYSSSTPALETEAEFDIEDGTNSATAAFTISSVTQSVSPLACTTVTSAALSIDTSSSGTQPNILGGSLSQNQSTTIAATLTGVDGSSFYPLSLGDADTAVQLSTTPAGTILEALSSPGIIADPTAGTGTTTYTTSVTNTVISDDVGGTVCGTIATPVPVYEFAPVINSSTSTVFDMDKSQVSDTDFTTNDLNQDAIQTFLSDEGSFLANFYVDTTHPLQGGWIDTSGSLTSTYVSADAAYCMLTTPRNRFSARTTCPSAAVGMTPGDSGTLLSSLLSTTAISNTINPKLLLVKMQVEAHLISSPTLPSSSSDDDADIDLLYGLDKALGCNRLLNIGTAAQLSCGASTYNMRFSDAASFTYPYFFPVNSSEKSALASNPGADITQSIQYAYASPSGNTDSPNGAGCQETLHLNCDLVGFYISDKATKVQYNYTPFVQTYTTSGGVRLFEYFWAKYTAASWE